MAQQPPQQVRVGVGVFILRSTQDPQNPQFLIGKRLGSHGSGTYALPGGHLEFNEEIETCAAREVKEETGLDISRIQFLTATNDIMRSEGRHYITLFVVCVRDRSDDEPKVLEPDKCAGWEWISWKDMVEIAKMQEEDGDAVDDGGNAKGGKEKKRLFTPLLSLLAQRPGFVPAIPIHLDVPGMGT